MRINIFSSLYLSLLIQMLGAALVSSLLFLFLDDLAHHYIQEQSKEHPTFLFSSNHHLYAGLVSLLMFFLLSLKIIFNLVSYINTIEKGIRKLPNEEDFNKIPIKGSHELARLAQSVNEIKEEIYKKNEREREIERQQRMLITNISHDLRTPLTSVMGYLDLAKQKISTKNEAHNYLICAEKSSHRLKKLITDLFLYSKVISKDIKMNFVKININTLLYQILELKTKRITFKCQINDAKSAQISLDLENFQRIIDNLLDNAIKYGSPDKDIILSNYSTDDTIIIEIQNHTDEDLSSKIQYLTNRLYRVDENRKDGSSGLGLSIVRELSKRMNVDFDLFFNNNIITARLVLYKHK